MSQPKYIDKAVHAHAILNMVQAVIQSPNGMLIAREKAAEIGARIEEACIALGESFAMAALRNIEQSSILSIPAGSGADDALTLYINVAATEGRDELEDRLQEGELAGNAIALLQNAPELWTPDAENPDDAPFPGTGANDGQERINDLIRAAAYVLAEIARIERKQRREDEYAARAAERGSAVMPDDVGDTTVLDSSEPTQH